MKRRNFIQAGLAAGASPLAFAGLGSNDLLWRDSVFTGLGTVLTIRAAHVNGDTLNKALKHARQAVERVEDEMSLFRRHSAVCQLNAAGVWHRPSADLLSILQISQHIAAKSRGAFDVTVQPLWQLYVHAQNQKRLPDSAEVRQALQRVGWQHLQVNSEQIKFMQPGMGISLNGIAQGYAADRVRESLARDGVQHALIHTGEWSSLGLADGVRPWTLGIADPHRANAWVAKVQMNGLSLATSADDQCVFSDDRMHHHIFDPHTGYSPQDLASVTVAAPSCVMADALTKVLFVAGYDRALMVAKNWGVSALVVKKNGEWKASTTLTRSAS